jgi:regulatory protein
MNYTPLNYALWLISRRDRSIGEIQTKMREKKFENEEIKQTISQLKKLNFLDDSKFAKHFISNQISIKPLGKYQLKQKLKRKFVSDEIIEKALDDSNLNESELVEEALKKWLKVNNSKDNKYEKISRHLISRGFDWEIVKNVIEKNKSKLTD